MKKLFFISFALFFILFGQQAKSSEIQQSEVYRIGQISGPDQNYSSYLGNYAYIFTQLMTYNGRYFLVIRLVTQNDVEFVPAYNICEATGSIPPVDNRFHTHIKIYEVFSFSDSAYVTVEIRDDYGVVEVFNVSAYANISLI